MCLLSQALGARVPFIHITTTDLVNVQEVLSHIARTPVYPLPVDDSVTEKSYNQAYYFTATESMATLAMYNTFKVQGKVLIFINTKPHLLQFSCGQLLPPQALKSSYLTNLITETKVVSDETPDVLLQAYSGMTLKDMYDATILTKFNSSKLSLVNINETRQGYFSKLKGLNPVATKLGYYKCPSYLKTWLGANSSFFIKPVVPSLTPRGFQLFSVNLSNPIHFN